MYDVLPSPIVIFGLPILVLYAMGIKVHVVFKPEVWRRWLSTPTGAVGSFECAPGCDGRRHLQDIGGDAMMLASRIAERAFGSDSTIHGESLSSYLRSARCQPASSSDLSQANIDRALLGIMLAIGSLGVIIPVAGAVDMRSYRCRFRCPWYGCGDSDAEPMVSGRSVHMVRLLRTSVGKTHDVGGYATWLLARPVAAVVQWGDKPEDKWTLREWRKLARERPPDSTQIAHAHGQRACTWIVVTVSPLPLGLVLGVFGDVTGIDVSPTLDFASPYAMFLIGAAGMMGVLAAVKAAIGWYATPLLDRGFTEGGQVTWRPWGGWVVRLFMPTNLDLVPALVFGYALGYG